MNEYDYIIDAFTRDGNNTNLEVDNLTVVNTNPETLFGGTWEQIKDVFLLSAGDTYIGHM